MSDPTNVATPADSDFAKVAAEHLRDLKAYLQTQRRIPKVDQTGAGDYTLVLTDEGKIINRANAAANNTIIPANASVPFELGTVVYLTQGAAGQCTLVADAGVTLITPSTLKTRKQNATIAALKTATNTWLISGDLAAS